jgi:hypothetical protein
MTRKPDPSYVVDLGNRLLKAKAEAKRLQGEWETLFGNSSDPSVLSNGAIKAPSMGTQIQDFLDSHMALPFTASQVAQALNLKPQSTASTLSKLVKAGLIGKYERDQYMSLKSPHEPDGAIHDPDGATLWEEGAE